MILVSSHNFTPKLNSFVYIMFKDGIYSYYKNIYIEVLKKELDCLKFDERPVEYFFEPIIKNKMKGGDYVYNVFYKAPSKLYDYIIDYYSQNNDIEKSSLIKVNNHLNFIVTHPDIDNSGGHVDYEIQVNNGENIFATIHNHPRQLNYHDFSETDNRDLKRFIGYDLLVSYPEGKTKIVKSRFNVLGKIVIPVKVKDIFEIN